MFTRWIAPLLLTLVIGTNSPEGCGELGDGYPEGGDVQNRQSAGDSDDSAGDSCDPATYIC